MLGKQRGDVAIWPHTEENTVEGNVPQLRGVLKTKAISVPLLPRGFPMRR